MKAWLPALLATLALLPQVALACPVCLGRDDAARVAFLGTTLFMSALPLALVFGAAWWLRRRSRALEDAREASRTELRHDPSRELR